MACASLPTLNNFDFFLSSKRFELWGNKNPQKLCWPLLDAWDMVGKRDPSSSYATISNDATLKPGKFELNLNKLWRKLLMNPFDFLTDFPGILLHHKASLCAHQRHLEEERRFPAQSLKTQCNVHSSMKVVLAYMGRRVTVSRSLGHVYWGPVMARGIAACTHGVSRCQVLPRQRSGSPNGSTNVLGRALPSHYHEQQ